LHFARELRKTMTDPERIMWALLRDRGLQGQKFRRQHPWLPYTLDFYCHELKLAVEIDGSQHADSPTDAGRDAALREAGIETVRYWNHDVVHRTEQVLEDLWGRMLERAPSPPAPLPGGEGSAVPSLAAPLPAGAGGGAAMSRDDAKRAFDDAILERLVALNAERAAEEARGHIRWLRPDYQAPDAQQGSSKLDLGDDTEETVQVAATTQTWPKAMPDQVAIIRDLLATAPRSLEALAAQFKRKPVKSIEPVLAAMQVLGHARLSDGQWRLV
jgi:very-short-patch-repair endonuclease